MAENVSCRCSQPQHERQPPGVRAGAAQALASLAVKTVQAKQIYHAGGIGALTRAVAGLEGASEPACKALNMLSDMRVQVRQPAMPLSPEPSVVHAVCQNPASCMPFPRAFSHANP